jgi:nucleoside-diphosphate-sugar epimerase
MVDKNTTQTVVITGITGFIGQHLLREFQNRSEINIRALTRHHSEQTQSHPDNKSRWIYGDLAEPSATANLLVAGCTFISLAFPGNWNRSFHIENTKRLADAAERHRVRRVIHCSTVVVVGNTRQQRVTEATEPWPQTEYEQTKLAIEQTWRAGAAGKFDLVIARPAAVFGPGGKNLLKLADALSGESRHVNYLRSALYSRRRMNLVHVRNVVTAICALMDHEEPFNGDIFNIADDDDPLNNFRDVERILMRELGVRDYALPRLTAPLSVLGAALRMAGRSNHYPDRVYDSAKLKRMGWRPDCGIEQGLREFAAWYLAGRQSVK